MANLDLDFAIQTLCVCNCNFIWMCPSCNSISSSCTPIFFSKYQKYFFIIYSEI